MLYLPKTAVGKVFSVPLLSTITSLVEGAALVAGLENGTLVAKTATPADTDKFLGFTHIHNIIPTELTKVETVTVPSASTYTVTLKRTPLTAASRLSVRNASNTNLTYHASTPADGVFTVSGSTITFHSAQAGATMTVTYVYTATVAEAIAAYGEFYTSANGAVSSKHVSLIKEGEIFTDQFDLAANWTSATSIKVGTGSKLILGSGTGASIDGYVTHVPTEEVPFLGIRFHAA